MGDPTPARPTAAIRSRHDGAALCGAGPAEGGFPDRDAPMWRLPA
jgi:hypothetical protein